MHRHPLDSSALSLRDTAVEQTSQGLDHVVDGLKSSPPAPSTSLPSSAPEPSPSSLPAPLSLSQALQLREAVRRRERTLLRTHEAALEELKRAQQHLQHVSLHRPEQGPHSWRQEEGAHWGGGQETTAREARDWEGAQREDAEQWQQEGAFEEEGEEVGADDARHLRVRVPSTLEPYWYERRDVGFRGQLRAYKRTMQDLDRCYYQRPMSAGTQRACDDALLWAA